MAGGERDGGSRKSRCDEGETRVKQKTGGKVARKAARRANIILGSRLIPFFDLPLRSLLCGGGGF